VFPLSLSLDFEQYIMT